MIDVESRIHGRGDYVWGSFLRVPGVDGYILASNPGDRSDELGRFSFSLTAVDEAVGAAVVAGPGWSAQRLDDRRSAVVRLADRLEQSGQDLARLMTRETGRALWESRTEVAASARAMRLVAEEAGDACLGGVVRDGAAGWDCRPLGVVGIITSFALPLFTAAVQTAAALLAGNTVVVKPSKYAPATGQGLAELVDSARLPRGVFNLVQGPGESVGQRLAAHPELNALLFTGQRSTAVHVRHIAAARPELVVLVQCADKSTALVLPDADLDLAVHELVVSAWGNAGQRHDATARVVVTADQVDVLCERLAVRARALRWGYGLDPGVFLGPMISEPARRAYRQSLTVQAAAGHATVVSGGPAELEGRKGAYVRPSVTWMKAAADLAGAVPGPTLRIGVVADVDEAVAVHNALSSRAVTAVFTRDEDAGLSLGRQLSTGGVLINRGPSPTSVRLPVVGRGATSSAFPAPLDLARALTSSVAWQVDHRPYDTSRMVPGAGSLPPATAVDVSTTLDG